jgi:hypothetical protein
MRNRTCSADRFPDHSCELDHHSKPIAYRRRTGAIPQWIEDQSHQARFLVFIQGSAFKMPSHIKRRYAPSVEMMGPKSDSADFAPDRPVI